MRILGYAAERGPCQATLSPVFRGTDLQASSLHGKDLEGVMVLFERSTEGVSIDFLICKNHLLTSCQNQQRWC